MMRDRPLQIEVSLERGGGDVAGGLVGGRGAVEVGE